MTGGLPRAADLRIFRIFKRWHYSCDGRRLLAEARRRWHFMCRSVVVCLLYKNRISGDVKKHINKNFCLIVFVHFFRGFLIEIIIGRGIGVNSTGRFCALAKRFVWFGDFHKNIEKMATALRQRCESF